MGYKTTLTATYDVDVPADLMGAFLDDVNAGVNYWAVRRRTFEDGQDNTVAVLFEMHEDASEAGHPAGSRFKLTPELYLLGIQRALNFGYAWTSHRPPGPDVDDWDFDAFDHDAIVQMAIFGDIIFG